MSGKSTFLRTVGVNLVLAQAGLPVNAKSMDFSPMHIQTSLKQSDNLHENVSLFHAELLRMKSIRNHMKKGELTLVLLDEMLRGTNSEDKLFGSRQLIEELLEENIFGLIASHDLELGKLEDKYPGKLRNACFESVITGNELIFDYKLKPGIARNKNATFLLKKMEIIHDKISAQ
jgi:DNA mismatch repair ATPase MutS